MRIRWTAAAAADLQGISDYLKEHHPHYRQPTIRKLYETIRLLKQAPYRGRAGTEEGTREILFPPLPYVAVYRVNGYWGSMERKTGLRQRDFCSRYGAVRV